MVPDDGNDPIVTTTQIANFDVRSILINNGIETNKAYIWLHQPTHQSLWKNTITVTLGQRDKMLTLLTCF